MFWYRCSIFGLLLCVIFSQRIGWANDSPVLLVIGTRPEAIKQLPCYLALKKEEIPVVICSTGQHAELLDDVFFHFGVTPDIELNIMKEGQDLFDITKKILEGMKGICLEIQPSLVVVQGDTTTAMAAALAAFYLKIPVGHVEAGLRTYDRNSPFPEEMNRRVISLLASYHFAPTQSAYDNLLREGIDKDAIFLTGNTVVDSLLLTLPLSLVH